jgi:hypothetical protein
VLNKTHSLKHFVYLVGLHIYNPKKCFMFSKIHLFKQETEFNTALLHVWSHVWKGLFKELVRCI